MFKSFYQEDNKIVALDEFKNRYIFDKEDNIAEILTTKNNIEQLQNMYDSYKTSKNNLNIKKTILLFIILIIVATNILIPLNTLVLIASFLVSVFSIDFYSNEKNKYNTNLKIKKIIKEEIKKEYKLLEEFKTSKNDFLLPKKMELENPSVKIDDLKHKLELIKFCLLNYKIINEYHVNRNLAEYLEKNGISDSDIYFVIKIINNFEQANEIIEEDQKQKKLIKG